MSILVLKAVGLYTRSILDELDLFELKKEKVFCVVCLSLQMSVSSNSDVNLSNDLTEVSEFDFPDALSRHGHSTQLKSPNKKMTSPSVLKLRSFFRILWKNLECVLAFPAGA